MERIIVVDKEYNEQEINITPEYSERIIDLSPENMEQEIKLKREGVIIIYTPSSSDHSKLSNLEYDKSGHIGFQEEMDTITNMEIERMWNSIWTIV